MFRRILIPVNFTAANRRSLEAARDLAARSGAKVTLIHVIEMLPRISFRELRNFYQSLYDQARISVNTRAGSTPVSRTSSPWNL